MDLAYATINTPASLTVVHAATSSTTLGAASPAPTVPQRVKLRVTNVQGDAKVFQIRKSIPLQSMIDMYCEIYNTNGRFMLSGTEQILPHGTAAALELEDGDEIAFSDAG